MEGRWGRESMCCWVGEGCVRVGRCSVRYGGGMRSGNGEISKDKGGEKGGGGKRKGWCGRLMGGG